MWDSKLYCTALQQARRIAEGLGRDQQSCKLRRCQLLCKRPGCLAEIYNSLQEAPACETMIRQLASLITSCTAIYKKNSPQHIVCCVCNPKPTHSVRGRMRHSEKRRRKGVASVTSVTKKIWPPNNGVDRLVSKDTTN